jgi:hypothetical protein
METSQIYWVLYKLPWFSSWHGLLGSVHSIIFEAQKMNLSEPYHVSFLPPHTLILFIVIISWFSYPSFFKFSSHFSTKWLFLGLCFS